MLAGKTSMMNQRIQALARTAGLGFHGESITMLQDELPETVLGRFAELIVRECAKVAFNDWCDGTNEGSSQMAILKHFGVE